MARTLPANTDPESQEMIKLAIAALFDDYSYPVASGPPMTQPRPGPSSSSGQVGDGRPRSIHGQSIKRKDQKNWEWVSEDEGASNDGPKLRPTEKCGWCEAYEQRCRGADATTRCIRCEEQNLECSIAVSYKAKNRALASSIAQARLYDQYSRNSSPAAAVKPPRCVVCRRNGQSGKRCEARGGREEDCPLYVRERSGGSSRVAQGADSRSPESERMKQPRRSRRDSSSEGSDRDRRDYPARPKKARSDSAPFPPPLPPPAPAPASAPATGPDATGSDFRRFLDEIRALDKVCDQAKAEAQRHKADAARALNERDAINAKVGSLENELFRTNIKLEEKTKALDQKSLAFNGVVGKALDSKDRVVDLETQVAELGRKLEEKEEELVQLGKLVASDKVKAASSAGTTLDLVQAKTEQVDAPIGSASTVNGNADEVIRALRADLAAMTAAKALADKHTGLYKDTATKASAQFHTLRTRYDELEESYNRLRTKYKDLGEAYDDLEERGRRR